MKTRLSESVSQQTQKYSKKEFRVIQPHPCEIKSKQPSNLTALCQLLGKIFWSQCLQDRKGHIVKYPAFLRHTKIIKTKVASLEKPTDLSIDNMPHMAHLIMKPVIPGL